MNVERSHEVFTRTEERASKSQKIPKVLKFANRNSKIDDIPSRKISEKKVASKLRRTRKSKEAARSKIGDSDWVGKSAVIKFFPTEVSDDEDRANSPLSPGRDFDSTSETSPRLNTDRPHQPRTNVKFDSKPFDECYLGINSSGRRVNIDFTPDDVGSTDSFNSFEEFTLIRHRPTVSAKVPVDYFVPKMQTPRTQTPRHKSIRRHNCNDEHDVTRTKRQEREVLHKHYPHPCPPLSVISERFQENIYTPVLPEDELCRFGEVYEANLLHHIHKYLEVDTFHRVVYVGPEKGSIASQVEKHFCLINGILSVFPGKIDYKDVEENSKLLAFKIAHVGAEEFFTQSSGDPAYKKAPFDRVIIHDAVQYFHNHETTFQNIFKVLHKYGKVLVIHRPSNLNTLPYFNSAKKRMEENDTPYMKIINCLQKLGADVEWDLVHVPIVIKSSKWLAMLKAKYPAQMEIMSNYEITCGLRELSEGPLKYMQDGNMEVEDRLMFITASLSSFDCAYPSVQRVGGASQVPYSGAADAKYYLPITEDIKHFLPTTKTTQYKMKGLF